MRLVDKTGYHCLSDRGCDAKLKAKDPMEPFQPLNNKPHRLLPVFLGLSAVKHGCGLKKLRKPTQLIGTVKQKLVHQ